MFYGYWGTLHFTSVTAGRMAHMDCPVQAQCNFYLKFVLVFHPLNLWNVFGSLSCICTRWQAFSWCWAAWNTTPVFNLDFFQISDLNDLFRLVPTCSDLFRILPTFYSIAHFLYIGDRLRITYWYPTRRWTRYGPSVTIVFTRVGGNTFQRQMTMSVTISC